MRQKGTWFGPQLVRSHQQLQEGGEVVPLRMLDRSNLQRGARPVMRQRVAVKVWLHSEATGKLTEHDGWGYITPGR